MMYKKQRYLLTKALKEHGIFDIFIKHGVVIAGGAIRAVFAGEKISDYDVYFKNNEIKNDFIKDFSDKATVLGKTDNAITFAHCLENEKIYVQSCILPNAMFEDVSKIIETFDFTCCMGAFDCGTLQFILHSSFLPDLARRELKINVNAKYPICTLFRVKKYIAKGYKISGTECVKLALAINKLNMKNYQELKEQLNGIDTLFLKELTDKLMSDEYREKDYDFNEFLEMLDNYFEDMVSETEIFIS